MVHGLKIAPERFAGQLVGTKTFELRADDRDFAVGDTLCLREWVDGGYTGRSVLRLVLGLLRGPAYGLQQGWVILSTGRLPLDRAAIREIFLTNGFTVKEGQIDLKPYVYDAAYALLDAQKDPS